MAPLLNAALGAFLLAAALIASASDYVSQTKPFGWLGSILVAVIGSFALYRAGSVKAWKSTADGRLQRIDDLTAEMASMREDNAALKAELKVPERIQGIIELMTSTAIHQDENATKRMEQGLTEIRTYVDARFEVYEQRAQERHRANIEVQQEMVKLLRVVRKDQVSDDTVTDL